MSEVQAKVLEVKNRATSIPVLAVFFSRTVVGRAAELLAQAGYAGGGYIILVKLEPGADPEGLIKVGMRALPATYDAHAWSSDEMRQAHSYMLAHWHELADGDAVDVRELGNVR